jgi:hypothetical protein
MKGFKERRRSRDFPPQVIGGTNVTSPARRPHRTQEKRLAAIGRNFVTCPPALSDRWICCACGTYCSVCTFALLTVRHTRHFRYPEPIASLYCRDACNLPNFVTSIFCYSQVFFCLFWPNSTAQSSEISLQSSRFIIGRGVGARLASFSRQNALAAPLKAPR